MSTKGHVFLTGDDDEVFFDSSNWFKINDEWYCELTFALTKKNIRIDSNDDEDLVFTIEKDCELYRELYKYFNSKNKQTDLTPNSYLIEYNPKNLMSISIICRKYNEIGLPTSWAIIENNDKCMSKFDGLFYYEPLPSSRNEEYFKEFRFSSSNEAYDFYCKFHKR